MNVVSVSSTSVVFTAPAVSGCDVTVVVTNPDGQSTSGTWIPAPIITNTIFTSGSAGGGQTFFIIGQNFVAGTTVTIGGTAATIVTQGASILNLQTPPGIPGAATVVVTTPAGCTVNTTYTYL